MENPALKKAGCGGNTNQNATLAAICDALKI